MKYFKFAQISAETGISWVIKQPKSGPSIPFEQLPGLTNIIQISYDNTFYLGEADDNATGNPDNYIFELTSAEYAEELQKHVEHMRQERLDRIYKDENDFRRAVFSKYDETATTAGVYKYEEAKALLADNTALAPQVRQEALIRNIDPAVMAQRIITNHEDFRNKEAKIAGIRGLVFDRLTNYTFDLQNPKQSLDEFLSVEKIGEITVKRFIDGQEVDVVEDITTSKYSLDISLRFQYLG